MLNQGAAFLADTVLGLFIVALLLRFYLQLFRAPYNNPLSPFIFAITDFLVKPARRIIPGHLGLDLATLVLAFLVELLAVSILLWLNGMAPHPFTTGTLLVAALLAVTGLVRQSLHIFMLALILQAVLSWVNPYSPLAPALNSLTSPFLGFFRNRLPPAGNVDLSPLFAIVIIQLLLTVPLAWVDSLLYGML